MSAVVCVSCGAPAQLKCSACQAVAYCSRDHQKQHWKSHKASCRPFEVRIRIRVAGAAAVTRGRSHGVRPALGPTSCAPFGMHCNLCLYSALRRCARRPSWAATWWRRGTWPPTRCCWSRAPSSSGPGTTTTPGAPASAACGLYLMSPRTPRSGKFGRGLGRRQGFR